MKPSTLHNLKKLMLVTGLALAFGLLTVSSTLATGPAELASLSATAARPVRQAVPAVEGNAETRVPDRVVAASETDPTALRLDGTATISPAGSTHLSAEALSQDWGDFDRDGYLDLALGTSRGISIYHNLNGRLVFSTSLTDGPGYGVRWADINNDGVLELITVKNVPGANGIYRYSAGSFVSYTHVNSVIPLARVVVLSGTRDLIASSSVISTPCTVLHFRKNTSTNLFTNAPTCVSTSASAALSAGDYDGDGDSDLVLGSFPNELQLLVNHAGVLTTTKFPTRTNFFVLDTTSSWPYDFAWGDYDGDGALDLAAAYPLQRQVRLYHNNRGSLTPFQLSGVLPTQRFMTPLSIDWGDFDGDGALDLALADDPPRVVFNIARSITTAPEAQPLTALPTGDTRWSARAVALDNSELSLALSGDLDPSTVYDTVGGHLRTQIAPLNSAAANSLAWGDTSGDGRLDLLLGAYALPDNSFLYLNANGTVTTTAATPFVSGNRQSVAIGKLDRKGDKQLGLIIGGGNSQGRGYINVYTGTNQLAQVLSLPFPVGALALGDFNNDGWLDLLAGTRNATGNGTLLLYRNNQTTFDTKPVLSATLSGQVQSVAWGDINPPDSGGNRFLDFAVATSRQVYIYRNVGNNTFAASSYAQNLNNRAVAWGDFDKDGDLDLAAGVDGQGVWIYRNVGDGSSFNLGWTSTLPHQTTSLAAGDWNNDGWIDLAVGNDGEPDRVYANSGQTPGDLQLVPVWASQETGSTTALAWGDANNDGYLDLAVSRQSGANGVYYNTAITPWRLSTPPTSVYIARPGKTFDAYLYSSSEFLPGYLSTVSVTLVPTVTLYYTVANPLGMPITNTQLELSLDGGSTWQTPFFTRTQVPNQTTPAGRGGMLTWNAWEDQAYSDNALFRLRVVDRSPVGPFQRAASVAVSPPFRVRSMTCQWLTGLWIEVSPSDQVQPLDTVTFKARVSDFSGGTISYTWTIIDGGQTRIVDDGYSQINHTYQNTGSSLVKLQAKHSICTEGPPLEAVTYVQVGTQTAGQIHLYLPLIQHAGATAQAASPVTQPDNDRPRAASVATALGGATACLTKTILPGTRPTVDWLAGVTGHHGQPALNDDGSRFAFWSTANLAGTNADGNIELYYAQVDRPGSCVTFTQITSSTGSIHEGFALGPALNAAGDRLAFFSDQNLTNNNSDRNFEVFLAQVNTTGSISVAQVTQSDRGVNAWPSLNAVGNRLAFVSDRSYGGGDVDINQEVYLAAIDLITAPFTLTQVTQTGLGTFNDEPALGASGERIAFVHGGSSTSGLQEIFTGATAPAGSQLAVTTSPSGTLNHRPTIGGGGDQYTIAYATAYLTQEIVSVAVVSGTEVSSQPVYTTSLNSRPALNAADGSRLLVISGTRHLDVLTLANQSAVPVYACTQPNCVYSALSGDGMHVVFASQDKVYEAYYEDATLLLTLNQPDVPVIAGAPLTRTIILANSGPGAVDGLAFSGTLRGANEALISITLTTSPSSVCSGAQIVTCRLPGLGVNSSVLITLTTSQPIDPAESGPLALLVNASAWQAVTTTMAPSLGVIAESDLRITKTLTTTAVAGELVTYTLAITNNGFSRASVVTVTDQLPSDLIFRSYSSSGAASFTLTNTDGLITGTLAHMNPYISGTIRIIAEIASTASVGLVISNTGVVTTTTFDPQPANNQHRADFAVTTRSSLTVTKSAPATVTAGLPLTYTIIVTNGGPSTAYDVLITDTLPVSVTALSVPAGCASLGANTQITCTLAALDKNSSHTIQLMAETDSEIDENTTLTNQVFATAANAVRVVSNTATTRTTVGSYLHITKTATTPVTAGDPLTYTIVVENRGPSRAWSLTVTDLWPGDYISYTGYLARAWYSPADPGYCTYTPGQVVCLDTGGLRNGYTQTYYLYATTYQTLPLDTVITNTASVTSSGSLVIRSSTAATNINNTLSRLTAGKSADATVLAGNSVHYTIVVTNSGPSYAPFVTVTDQLPDGVTFLAGTASAGCQAISGGTVVECAIANLLRGAAQRQTVTITGLVSYTVESGDTLTNTAAISASNAAASVNVTATTAVRTSSALALRKTATQYVTTATDPAATGEVVTYTLVVTNNGPSLARNVVLTDMLPVSVTYLSQVSATPLITPSLSGRTLTWQLDPIAPGAVNTFTITGQVLTTTVGPVTLTNTAGVTATTAPALITATASTMVQPRVRLALTKTLLTPQPVTAQSVLTYQIVVQNLGPSVVPSVTMTDVLEAWTGPGGQNGIDTGEGAITWNGATCDRAAGSLTSTCTITPELAAGASRVITLSATTTRFLSNGPTVTNTVYATATIATAVVSATEIGTTVARATLLVTKTLSPLNAVPVAGQWLTYSVTVGNLGPSDVPVVTLTDTLPSELLTPTVSSDCGGPVGRVVTCTVGSINVDSTWFITIAGRLPDSLPAGYVITNSAAATTTIATGLATNLLTNTVAVQANLRVSKSANATARAGAPLTYTLVVTNEGPSLASSVTLTDRLPISLTYLSQIDSEPAISLPISTGNWLTWTLGDMAPQARQIITFNVQITDTVGGSARITNTAYVTSTRAPTVAQGTAVTQIQDQSNFIITKTVLTANPVADENVTYSITVTNLGPSLAPSVTITDQVPAELTYGSFNLALNRPVTSSLPSCNATEGPEKAVNGSVSGGDSDKWCDDFNSNKWLQVDLGSTLNITRFVVSHAGAGGESTNLNTRAFNIETSTDGMNFTRVVTVTSNTNSVTTHTIATTTARFVRLNVVTGAQSGPNTARIYEFEVYGSTGRWSTSPGCSEYNALVTCTKDSPLGVYSSWGITITGRLRSSAITPFTNTAYATATIATALVSDSAVTTPTVQVGLQVTKSAPLTVLAGNPLTYSIYVTNTGPSRAPIITLTDQLPLSVTLIAGSTVCGPAGAGNVVTCTLTNVDVGPANSQLVVLTSTVDSRVITGTPLVNTVVVTSSYAANAVTATVTTTAQTSVALRATKQANPASVLAGNPLTYTIIVTNDGPSLAPGLIVTDGLPAELNSVLVSPECSLNDGVVTCAAFPLDKNAFKLITITGQIVSGTLPKVITNTAYVSPTFNAARFSQFITTTVNTAADLAIGTTITPTSVVSNAASAVRVTIVFTNSGPSNAQTVFITQTLGSLPYTATIAQSAYVTGPTDVNCGGVGRPACTWRMTTLTATLTGTIEFLVTVPITTAAYTQDLSAYITSTLTSDPVPANNTSPGSLTITRMVSGVYWAGLLPARWPLALISSQPRNVWPWSP